MAERHELRGALGGLDAGDAGRPDHVALRRVAAPDRVGRLGRDANDGGRPRAPVGHVLAADVHHPGAARVVDVAQAADGTVPSCAFEIRSRTAWSSPWRSSSIWSG